MTKTEEREMNTLRMRVEELTQALADATVGDNLPWHNAHVPDPRSGRGYDYAATPHRALRFYTSEKAAKDGRRWFDISLGIVGSLRLESGPQLLVVGEGRVLVRPHASNAVAIELDRQP